MRKKEKHDIKKEINGVLKEKITGDKTVSLITVLIVIISLVIIAVVGKFGEYIGTNRIFPKWANSLFQDNETDTSKPILTDVIEDKQNAETDAPRITNVVPTQISATNNNSEIQKEIPTTKEESLGHVTSESLKQSVKFEPNEEPDSLAETKKDTTPNTISVSCIPIEFPLTDKNAEIRAVTSFEATKVVLVCEANGFKYGEWDMKTSDSHVWTFDADFYESNTYTLTVIAYNLNGEQAQDSIDVKYPF